VEAELDRRHPVRAKLPQPRQPAPAALNHTPAHTNTVHANLICVPQLMTGEQALAAQADQARLRLWRSVTFGRHGAAVQGCLAGLPS